MAEEVKKQCITISNAKFSVVILFAVGIGFILGILFPATRVFG